MAIAKTDVKNVRVALRPDFQQVREEMGEKFDGVQQQMNTKELASKLLQEKTKQKKSIYKSVKLKSLELASSINKSC